MFDFLLKDYLQDIDKMKIFQSQLKWFEWKIWIKNFVSTQMEMIADRLVHSYSGNTLEIRVCNAQSYTWIRLSSQVGNHLRHFDFADMTWKSRGQPILDDEWMNIEDVHINYPILNDRIAYSRGTVKHR